MSEKKFSIKDIFKPGQKKKIEKEIKPVVKETISKREAVRKKLEDTAKKAEDTKEVVENFAATVEEKVEEAKALVEDAADEAEVKSSPAKIHVVQAGETLSHIALNYYGKATPPYYQHIYNHNRDVIGDNINIIVPGQKLVIPELPEELK